MTESVIHQTNFVPNPVQRRFIESRAQADLYSSRMGEGKSTALAWAAFYHTKHNPGAKWVISRDTWENLQATTQKTFFEWFPPGIFGTYHHTKKEFTWASGVAEGTVQFLGMDDQQDASKLMSRDFAGIAIDEPAPAVGSAGIDQMIFDIALSRLRQPGMKWYAMKLAENNPDEAHWTYARFVQPGTDYTDDKTGQHIVFRVWQPQEPENVQNLPPSYYQNLRRLWQHRPDLVRRFVDGEFGFQAEGRAVTPQWSDKLHLTRGLLPVKGVPLILLWDWGHNPTCVITQKTPLGHWNFLDALVGEDIGAEELIEAAVKPLLIEKYPKFTIRHIGDSAGTQREQTSIFRTPVRATLRALGGTWRSGPVKLEERIEPLRAVLARNIHGRGVVQVDKDTCPAVWQALRGGWHFKVSRTGITSGEPVKNIHSHPGDAVSYGAAVLFPMGRLQSKGRGLMPQEPQAFGTGNPQRALIGGGTRGMIIPQHGQELKPQEIT